MIWLSRNNRYHYGKRLTLRYMCDGLRWAGFATVICVEVEEWAETSVLRLGGVWDA